MDYKNKVQEAIKYVRNRANLIYDVDIGEFDVKYDLSTQNALGKVVYNNKITMRLNPLLLEENADLYIKEVVLHELAHIIVNKRFPTGYDNHRRVQPHGKEFKAVCRILGTNGKSTTTAFNNSEALKRATITKQVQKKKQIHLYECDCEAMKHLSTIRHNKVQKKKAQYRCGDCGRILEYYKTVTV